jgi:uncharacterized protein
MTSFDPFKSRLCRNIRNELSVSLMDAIDSQDIGPANIVARKYGTEDVEPFIDRYIHDRLTRYKTIIDQIRSAHLQGHDTFRVALLLWDQELFFEVHEWLEKTWRAGKGAEKMISQALIRAAGVYIHLEHGRTASARKMALKAAAGLTRYKALAPSCFNVERLIDKLKALDPVPPKFGALRSAEKSRRSK